MTTARRSFAEEWRQWYARAEAALTAPYGFLSVTGLTWLGPAAVDVPGVPGRWRTDGDAVVVDLGPDDVLRLGDRTVRGRVVVRPASPDGEPPGDALVWHDRVLVEVVRRAEGVFVRPRDPDHPRRTGFPGTPSYPPAPGWRLRGVWVPPRRAGGTVALASALPGVTNHYGDLGTVRLELGGRERELVLIRPKQAPARLVFRDATSGRTTYPRGRYVDLDLPAGHGEEVTVDFNRARNFPCSYSPAPTCPAAPAQNVLDAEVDAGAQYPPVRTS